nr:hypothetical protein [Tanacetum cinerariifolium]
MVGSDIDGYTARFHELARLVPHMVTTESQCVNRYIRGLAPKIKAHVTSSQPATIQGAVSMANRLTTDGIKDGIFKKKENVGNIKRELSCVWTMQASGVGHFTQYCTSRVVNERPRPNCYECGDPNHFRRNCPRMNQATTAGGNRPNPVLAIEGNPKPGNNRNRAQAPTAQTMFIANLSSATPFYDQAGLSYDSDTLSEDNEAPVVQSDASFVPNDTVIMVTNDVYEQDALCVTFNQPNNIVNASLTTELARYKELAKVYEKRAQFELTRRELMIDTQMRMIIKDRNFKEESLQKELHSIKIQLNSTINHNKLLREKVSTLKQDFKQKESKLLEEFLEMKLLKEKEIVKPNHMRVLVHDSEDTLEIAETTRKQMITKMNDPEYVKNKAKALKEKAKSAKPFTAITVYPPNTPVKLVPKVLPTKSQVQLNIYSLVQPFSEFDKTCKKRITPTGLTEGERGIEQTKTCYLTEALEPQSRFLCLCLSLWESQRQIMPVIRQGTNDAITLESIQAMIDRSIQRNSTHTQDDASQSLGGGLRRHVQSARVCSYTDFMKCQPLNFKGTEGVVGLSRWLENTESVFHISSCAINNQVKFATLPALC